MSIFSQVQGRAPKKNKFDLSHMKILSCKMGKLVPILCKEVIPGDNWRLNAEIMARLSPMISPVYGRMNIYKHDFFVPSRLLWDEFEDFITGGTDGTLLPTPPFYSSANIQGELSEVSGLADYLGLPTPAAAATLPANISALPFRAYQLIFNEYFRDQTLTPEVPISKTGGQQLANFEVFTLQNRAYKKDYFTSALPFSQRGPESEVNVNFNYLQSSRIYEGDGSNPVADAHVTAGGLGIESELRVGASNARIENLDSGSITINELRRSVRLQEWLEKNARGGARYVEQLLSHFGVFPQDARLQRPEYIAGWKQPITISEVLNMSGDTAGTTLQPVGEMAGHGISVGSSNYGSYNAKEHGYIFSILSIIPEAVYYQGIERMWDRPDKLDYAWPEFAQLGEQPIKNKELFWNGTFASQDDTFGYTPRYSEYKYACDTVSGEFRTTLEHWHVARKFDASGGIPALNDDFIKVDPEDTKRIFAVTTPESDDFYVQVYHNISALRPLPYYGTPTL